MKKLYKKIVSLVMSALLAVMVLPVTTHASNQQDNDIVYGADIGWLSQMENQGIQYLNEDGNVDDALSVLKNKGINAVRLRVFVNPETDFVGQNLMEQHVFWDIVILKGCYILRKEPKI